MTKWHRKTLLSSLPDNYGALEKRLDKVCRVPLHTLDESDASDIYEYLATWSLDGVYSQYYHWEAVVGRSEVGPLEKYVKEAWEDYFRLSDFHKLIQENLSLAFMSPSSYVRKWAALCKEYENGN